jgi:glycosyltransferase involved in cell wall biosynthesis
VALIHYWLIRMRGGERVLEALCEMFPEADIFTHVVDPDAISPTLKRHRIRTTFIAKLPGAKRHYQKYLPLMPLALEELDLSDYDIIISSESGPAKGVVTRPDALHVCYCHSPMRYAWDHYHLYKKKAGRLTRLVMPPLMHQLRIWDVASAARVDHFIANSAFVASRIRKYYRRDSDIVHPPVDVEAFAPAPTQSDAYLLVGELVAYKRADLAIAAFTKMGKRLIVIGDGEERQRVQQGAGANIEFLGRASFDRLREAYASCRALIFPNEEDFGIVPVEAMASGRPVIALGRGGARDSIVEGETGLFFEEQSVDGLIAAVERFEAERGRFSTPRIVEHARRFSREAFKSHMRKSLAALHHPYADTLIG